MDDVTVRNFSEGQEKAFRILYDRYSSGLRFFTARYLEERDGVDDIVQDAFVSLWEKRRDFSSEKALKVYLYTFSRNAALNQLRHRGVKERYAERMLCEEDGTSFLDHILEAEMFQLLQRTFNELSPACRKVYALSLSGKTCREIAEKMNITVNTVKKHKNNANHFMRSRLKEVMSLLIAVWGC